MSSIKLCLIVAFCFIGLSISAQYRTIKILNGNNFRQIIIDSATILKTISGNVIIQDGTSIINCDSASINEATKVAEAFGKVHMIDADTMHIYGNYIWYNGITRKAIVKNNVKVKQPQGQLYCETLDYDIGAGIGKFTTGGKILGKNGLVLTSLQGIYNTQTKNVIFKDNVHLVDTKNDIKTDSLLFNTETELATFIAPTKIKNNNSFIETTAGNYNLKTGEATLYDNPVYTENNRKITGNNIKKDASLNTIFINGNARIVDKEKDIIATSDDMQFEQKSEILILINNASIIDNKNKIKVYGNKIQVNNKTEIINLIDNGLVIDEKNKIRATGTQIQIDQKLKEILIQKNGRIIDSVNKIIVIGNEIFIEQKINSIFASQKPILISYDNGDSTYMSADTFYSATRLKEFTEYDSINSAPKTQNHQYNEKDSVRYFLGYKNVKIFNDSIQGICDSVHYTSVDSSFKMFGNPFLWNENTQINGDTMYLFTKNQEPDKVFIFNKGMIVNKLSDQSFNQVAGKRLTGYFKAGKIDWMRVRGAPTESIFYPQDDDSAYIGMNVCSGDMLDAFFVNGTISKIKFTKDVSGVLYPMNQIPEDKLKLRNFIWNIEKRPKNKLAIFE